MREIRLSGSEGGGALTGSPYPYPPMIMGGHFLASALRQLGGESEGLQRVRRGQIGPG